MKNKILKTITAISAVLLVIGICTLDSDSMIPFIVSCICLAWIVPFLKINGIIGGLGK